MITNENDIPKISVCNRNMKVQANTAALYGAEISYFGFGVLVE